MKCNKIKHDLLEEELKASGELQVSTTDANARALQVQGEVIEILYDIQAAVDDKQNFVLAINTINCNDKNALSAIAQKPKKI